MEWLIVGLVGFCFSFLGSIPPGAINISVIQLSVQGNFAAAFRFALASAIVEYPYALIAVKFEGLITSSPFIVDNFHLISASVMLLLGIVNLWSSARPSELSRKFSQSGFRKGVLISLLNPLAIPFWIGVTAFLKSKEWLVFNDNGSMFTYVAGISLGTFSLLMLLALLAKKISRHLNKGPLIAKIPGFVFLALGIYALVEYFLK
ncbi:MAG: LysE family transporter [Bacteroidota bacterium]